MSMPDNKGRENQSKPEWNNGRCAFLGCELIVSRWNDDAEWTWWIHWHHHSQRGHASSIEVAQATAVAVAEAVHQREQERALATANEADLRARVAELTSALEANETLIQALREEVRRLQHQRDQLTSRLTPAEAALANMRLTLARLTRERDFLQSKLGIER